MHTTSRLDRAELEANTEVARDFFARSLGFGQSNITDALVEAYVQYRRGRHPESVWTIPASGYGTSDAWRQNHDDAIELVLEKALDTITNPVYLCRHRYVFQRRYHTGYKNADPGGGEKTEHFSRLGAYETGDLYECEHCKVQRREQQHQHNFTGD